MSQQRFHGYWQRLHGQFLCGGHGIKTYDVVLSDTYFAENAPGWSPFVFKAWQHLNPIGFKWMQWLYVWNSKRMKHRKEINEIDYELAFNWRWNGYYLLTAEQLKDDVFKATRQLLSADAIKKRRERLGFTTQRPTGPPPTTPNQ